MSTPRPEQSTSLAFDFRARSGVRVTPGALVAYPSLMPLLRTLLDRDPILPDRRFGPSRVRLPRADSSNGLAHPPRVRRTVGLGAA